MEIITSSEFIESARDARAIYANGERLRDVTTSPPFTGGIATRASLYDLNHERPAELTFTSPVVQQYQARVTTLLEGKEGTL